MNKKHFLLLGLIVVLATFLRFYKITQIPSGFFFDEVTVGVNSSLLANNLHDEFGHFLPDFVKVGDDYRHISLFYITAFFIRILGSNVFAVRAATATFGVLIVIATYFLADSLFKKKQIALLSALLVSISPWLINLSRSSNEVIVALFFVIAADVMLLRGYSTGRKIYFILSYLFFVLTWFSYSGAIAISIIHLISLSAFMLVSKKSGAVKVMLISIIAAFIIFPNLFYTVLQPKKITGRFNQVSIFSDKGTQLILNEQIREDGSGSHPPLFISRIYHNKIVDYSFAVVNNYVQYFSGQFFLGIVQLPQRYQISNTSLIYLIEIPFFFMGLFWIFRKVTWQSLFIVLWFFAGAIPASLTTEDIPNMQRAIFMLPAWQIISAFGLYCAFSGKNKYFDRVKISRPVILVIVSTSFVFLLSFFMHQLFYHQPRHQNWNRGSEWEPAVNLLDKIDSNYSKVIITGPLSYYHLVFYSQTLRNSILNNPDFINNRSYQSTWNVGKYSFVSKQCILPSLEDVEINVLYVNGQNCEKPGWARNVGTAKTSDGVVMLTFLDVPLTKEQLNELRLLH